MRTTCTDRATCALELGVRDRDTITEFIKRGWLDGHRVGRRWLITRKSLDRLLAQGTPAKR